MKTIAISGPESTGKSLISAYLADQLNCPFLPEYARDYIAGLSRPYNYDDLLHIAESQVKLKTEAENSGFKMLVLDTWLIITKIWFMEVYNKYPTWLDEEIAGHKIDLYIILKPDIPWIPDPLRENGGKKRIYLMNKYIEEIRKTGYKYAIIGGQGERRIQNVMQEVSSQFNLPL